MLNLKTQLARLSWQNSQVPWWQDRLFLLALLLAVVVHVVLLSAQFVAGSGQPSANKEVTVAVHLSKDKVKNADFEAQADQQGQGQLKSVHAQTVPIVTTPKVGALGESEQALLEQLERKQALDFQERMLMTALSWKKQSQSDEKQPEQQAESTQEQQQPSQSNTTMIATLEAQFARRQQAYAQLKKVKTATDSVQAAQSNTAKYLEHFRQKVEQFGNRYYPEAAKQQNLSGEVRLMVVLNNQGGIRAIRLLESSGNVILDDAAKDSVRRATPFGQFSSEMNKDISELRIVRTWRFDAKGSAFDVR